MCIYSCACRCQPEEGIGELSWGSLTLKVKGLSRRMAQLWSGLKKRQCYLCLFLSEPVHRPLLLHPLLPSDSSFFGFPIWTKHQRLSMDLPGLQCQIGTAEVSGFVGWAASWPLEHIYMPTVEPYHVSGSDRSPFIMCMEMHVCTQTHIGPIAFGTLKHLCNTWRYCIHI